MTKHQRRDRPEAKSPAPQIEKPEATKTPEAPVQIPPTPPIIQGTSKVPIARWGVPEWLVLLAAWTGSEYGKNAEGVNNLCGILPTGTMPVSKSGYAWFGNPTIGMDQFGQVCHSMGLDYSNPKECVRRLKPRCPKIDTVSYTLFTEA
jgi:hypothetical protein